MQNRLVDPQNVALSVQLQLKTAMNRMEGIERALLEKDQRIAALEAKVAELEAKRGPGRPRKDAA